MSQQDLPCTPPSPNNRGWGHFFRIGVYCQVPTTFFPKEKVDFVGDIRTKTWFLVITTQTQFKKSGHYLIISSNLSL